MGQSRHSKPHAARLGNEPKRTMWLWLVPRCGAANGSTTSDSQLDETLPASIAPSAAPVLSASARNSTVSPVASSCAAAVSTKGGSEGKAPVDKRACSIDAEQHDAFQVGAWQIQSTTKAKSEGQVLSSDIFPPSPMSSASASAKFTRGMQGEQATLRRSHPLIGPGSPLADRPVKPMHRLGSLGTNSSTRYSPLARCALVHSTLASLESYCRTSAPPKFLLASQQLSTTTDPASVSIFNSQSAGCSTSSSQSQWFDEPGSVPQARHSAPLPQQRLYMNAHRLLDSMSSGQLSPSSVPVGRLADALEGLSLKAPRGSGADPEVGFKIRNFHVQQPPGSELLMSVSNQVFVSMFDASQGVWVANQLDTNPSDVPQILSTSCIVLHSEPCSLSQVSSASFTTTHEKLDPDPTSGTARNSVSAPLNKTVPIAHAPISTNQVIKVFPGHTETQPTQQLLSARQPAVDGSIFRIQVTTVNSSSQKLHPHVTVICNGVRKAIVSRSLLLPMPKLAAFAPASPPKDATLTPRKHSKSLDLDSANLKIGPTVLMGLEVSFPSCSLPKNGLLMVECRLGRLVSNSRPVVITDDAQFAAELSQLLPEIVKELAASQGSGSSCKSVHDPLLVDFGCWLGFQSSLMLAADSTTSTTEPATAGPAGVSLSVVLQPALSPQKTHGTEEENRARLETLYTTAAARAYMTQSGLTLLEFAVGRGWLHIAASVLLGLQRLGCNYRSLSRASAIKGPGLSLPQRAQRAGSASMLTLVLGWEGGEGFAPGYEVAAGFFGGRGPAGHLGGGSRSTSGSDLSHARVKDNSAVELSFKQALQQKTLSEAQKHSLHIPVTLLQQYGKGAVSKAAAAAADGGSMPQQNGQLGEASPGHPKLVTHHSVPAPVTVNYPSSSLKSNSQVASIPSAQLHPFQPPYFRSHPHQSSMPMVPPALAGQAASNGKQNPSGPYAISPARSGNGSATMAHDMLLHGNSVNAPLISGKMIARTKSWLSRSLIMSGTSPPATSLPYTQTATLVQDMPTGPPQHGARWPKQQQVGNISISRHQLHVPSLLTHAAAMLQARSASPSPGPSQPSSGSSYVPYPSPHDPTSSGYYRQLGSAGMLSSASNNSIASADAMRENSPTLYSLRSLPSGKNLEAHSPLLPRISFPVHGSERHTPSFTQVSLAYRSAPMQRIPSLDRRHASDSDMATSGVTGITSVLCDSPALSLASLLQLYKTPHRTQPVSATAGLLPLRPAASDREAFRMFVSLRTSCMLRLWFVVVFGALIGLLDFAIRSDRVRGPLQILPCLACHCLCAGWILLAPASFSAHQEDILTALAVARFACLVLLPLALGRSVMVMVQPPLWHSGTTLFAAVLAQSAFAVLTLLPVYFEQVRVRRAVLLCFCRALVSLVIFFYTLPSRQSIFAAVTMVFWNLVAAALAAHFDCHHWTDFVAARSRVPTQEMAQIKHRL